MFFLHLVSREWVCQRPSEVVPVLQTQHNTCKLHFFHFLMSWMDIFFPASFYLFFFPYPTNDPCVCVPCIPAPHAPVLHLLPGFGTGPGSELRAAAGQRHPAHSHLHPGGSIFHWLQKLYGLSFPATRPKVLFCLFRTQPLLQRRLEHEKKRKEIKENWIRAKRKLVHFVVWQK